MGIRTTCAVAVVASWIAGTAWAGQVELAKTKISVELPDGWSSSTEHDYDVITAADGTRVALVIWQEGACDATISKAAGAGASIQDDPPGIDDWSGSKVVMANGDSYVWFCREVNLSDGTYALLVQAESELAAVMLPELDDGIARAFGDGMAADTQAIALRKLPLTVHVPDNWVTRADDLGDDQFSYTSGAKLGLLHVGDQTCADMIPTEIQLTGDNVIATAVVPRAGWSGFEYHDYLQSSEPYGYYCRDITLGFTPHMVAIRGQTADIPPLLVAFDAAYDDYNRHYLGATPEAWTETHDVPLEYHGGTLWMDLTVRVPAAWTFVHVADVTGAATNANAFTLADGRLIGEVGVFDQPCEAAIEAVLGGHTTQPLTEAVPGWVGNEVSGGDGALATYCRDFTRGGESYGMIVNGPPAVVPRLVTAVSAGLDAFLGTSKSSRPSRRSRLLPTRYELGFSRLTNGDAGTLDVPEGWGATIAIERTIYGRGVPAFGYRARLTPTTVGLGGYLEGSIGAGVKILAAQAVVGVGGDGSAAPFGPYAGVRAALVIPRGLEAEAGYAWTQHGTRLQIEGRFFFTGSSGRSYSMGFGYEKREASSVITIDIGVIFLPDFD